MSPNGKHEETDPELEKLLDRNGITKQQANRFWEGTSGDTVHNNNSEQQAVVQLYKLREAFLGNAHGDAEIETLVSQFDAVVKQKLGEGKSAAVILREIQNELTKP